jgi:hypothetical protein
MLSMKMQFRAIEYWAAINDSILYIDLTAYNDKEINNAFDSLEQYKH